MKSLNKIILIQLGLFFTLNGFAQQSRYCLGDLYKKYKDTWFVIDTVRSDSFPVDTTTVGVIFNDGTSSGAIDTFESEYSLSNFNQLPSLNIYFYHISNLDNVFDLAEEVIDHSPIVVSVEISSAVRFNIVPPDDPYYTNGDLWHLFDPIHGNDINAEQAWDFNTGCPEVKVGIVDSGTDWDHPDLGIGNDTYQNIYLNTLDPWGDPDDPTTGNTLDDDNNLYADDYKGWDFYHNNNDSRGTFFHGTATAGIVAAKTNNNLGVAGVAGGWTNEGAKLILAQIGEGIYSWYPTYIFGINYVNMMGAQIIDLTFSGMYHSSTQSNLYNAYHSGTFIVCSSGDSGPGPVTYPASDVSVFSVGATDRDDKRSSYSNYGIDLDVSAPGDIIISTDLNNNYTGSSGTSFSAPIVSGIAALMLCQNECLTNTQLDDVIKNTSEQVQNIVNGGLYNYNWTETKPHHSEELGYGRVDAYEAVKAADELYLPSNVDLYMKDTRHDWSVEPNPTTEPLYESEDIWVRHTNDGIQNQWNQNPEYDAFNPNSVYVKIRNHGCNDFTSAGEMVHLYWSKASTGLSWPTTWDNFYDNCPTQPVTLFGDEIESGKVIPNIPAGQETIIRFEWYPPDPALFSNCVDNTHFCLLARIPVGMTTTETSILWQNVRDNNNIVWKNVTVVDDIALNHTGSGQTIIRNVYDDTTLTKIFFKFPENESYFLDYGSIKISLGSELFERWMDGGSVGDGFEICDDTILKLSGNAWIGNILMDTSEIFVIESFYTQYIQQFNSCYSNFDIQQQDSLLGDTTILTGGVRFQLNTCNEESEERRAASNSDHNNKNKIVRPHKLYPNPNSGDMYFEYNLKKSEVGELRIYDPTGRVINSYILKEGKNTLLISEQNITTGIYYYEMFVNEVRIDGDKIFIVK